MEVGPQWAGGRRGAGLARAVFYIYELGYRIITPLCRGAVPRGSVYAVGGRGGGRSGDRGPQCRKSDREIVPILRRTGRPTWNVPGGGGPLRLRGYALRRGRATTCPKI